MTGDASAPGGVPSPRLRWGVLGTGGITSTVVPAIARSEHCRVDAIASRSLDRARKRARRLGVPNAYGSYGDLLDDPAIDVVYIPLPNFLHREWVLAAVAAGKHVLCEKPMAITADEAQEMVDAADAAGVVLAEAFMYGHHPRYDLLHAVVRSGEIGEVRSITGTFTFDATDEPDLTVFAGHPGSGAVYDVGCYPLHAARTLLRAEPVAVTAHAQVSPVHGGADMLTCALVEFPDGVSLLLQCGMWAADEDTLRISGSRGRIEMPSAFFAAPGAEGFTVQVGDERRDVEVPRADHYTLQADRLARAVLFGEPLRYPPGDPVRGAAALEACARSLRTRSRVSVPLAGVRG
jgi:D-xylose 1-dehydrogenase (NADP+, D-xylono-1,5-lactone-forming)